MQSQLTFPKVPQVLCQSILNKEFEIDIGNISETHISGLIEDYIEAMSIYMKHNIFKQGNTTNQYTFKGHKFYQDKIKRLLTRNDVQKCLLGYKTNPRAIDLQNELKRVQYSAPEQAKSLIEYYRKFHKQQKELIQKTVDEQNQKLKQRIYKRSKSKNSQSRKQNSNTNSILIMLKKL